MAASTVSSGVPPSPPGSDSYAAASSLVLLDRWCYIADVSNNTTAVGTTSSGLPIKVAFRDARPPHRSHFCVHCPGLDFSSTAPRVVATDADLVLLCVPVEPYVINGLDWDYFVYRLRARKLDRLPNPHPRWLDDSATALLSRKDSAWYVIAALGVRPPVYDGSTLIRWEYDLHLYRSSNSEGWISKRLSLNEFKRDKVIPLPTAVDDKLYHETEKTITIGGEYGTVAWVDLWRGIFLCDVLKEFPVLQDVPLPVPARGNWDRLLKQCDPSYFRDVTVSQNKDTIKYIEMEFWSPVELNVNPVSYIEWVRNNSREFQVIRDGWKSTTWSMAIPAGSWEDWHRDYEVDVKDINLDGSNPCHSKLLAMLSSKGMRTLKELSMTHPTVSMDGDVVYLLSRNGLSHMDKFQVVFAIDVRKGTLQGLAGLDVQNNFISMPAFCTSDICRYLKNIAGTGSSAGTKMKSSLKPTEKEEGKPSDVHLKNWPGQRN
ncbi:unnamed protein product [Urochloa humidicola]